MTYSRADNDVTVEFTVPEYAELLSILGAAIVMAKRLEMPHVADDVGQFLVRMNRTNRDVVLYAKQIHQLKPPDEK